MYTKKSLLTLLGLGTIGFLGFSQSSNFIQERVLQRIEREKKFEMGYFVEYLIKEDSSKNNNEFKIGYYDFNSNGKPDLLAFFKQNNLNSEIIMIDKDENNLYEFTYIDNDKDGIFDEKEEDIHKTEFIYLIENEMNKLIKDNQKIIEREEFERRFKEYLEKNKYNE